MDNLEREANNEGIVTGPRPLVVCSVCGPRVFHYAGNIVQSICKRCAELTKQVPHD